MKEAIRSYHMFLPRKWLKWCIYIGYPAVIAANVYVLNRYATFFSFVCIGMACFMTVAVEFMLDTYMFFGIAARDTNRLEYLKTSAKGLLLLKKALAADAVRRFFSVALILAAVYLVLADDLGTGGGILLQYMACTVITCLLIELGFVITRRFMNVWLNLVVIYILGGIASGAGIYISQRSALIVTVVVAAVLYVAAAAAGRLLVLKRAKESYYDR